MTDIKQDFEKNSLSFLNVKNEIEDDSWDDLDPSTLCLGMLDPDILESTLDAADPETRSKMANNLKKKGFLQG